ncbi:MAG TPA: MFS transporter, partial [Candidatus Polarisedimenticolaceae bacterium]|nr:MFS transporter [Candidatus Polarisedimenticolaceae bacterium]
LSKVFLFALVPGILAVILTFLVRSPISKPLISFQVLGAAVRSYFGIFKPSLYPSAYKKLLIGLVLVGIFNSSDIFLLLRASELLGSRQEIAGIVFPGAVMIIGIYVIFNIVSALLSLVAGAQADKRGFRNTFIAGLVAFGVSYGLLSRDLGLPGLIIAFSIYALFAAVNESVVKAWVSTYLPKERLGGGLGVANTVVSLSFLVSSILTGLIWQSFSSHAALSVLSLGIMVPIMYMLVILPNREPEKRS